MGHGGYDFTRAYRKSVSYKSSSASEIFQSRSVNNAMAPSGIDVRESRDSEEHPNSVPIIIALDVTGSMGSIPHHLVREGLNHVMEKIIELGVADPQVLFLGIGDHECDRAPLQVGQFESSDELLDNWLTKLWIEGGGGGNDGESYLLAWYFAANHTATDHWDKRNKKGLLFTIGDEPTLREVSANALKGIMGSMQASTVSAAELLDKARERYEVYHLHLNQGHNGRRQNVKDGWTQLMGNHMICVQNQNQVVDVIADKIVEVVTTQGPTNRFTEIMNED